MTPDEMQFFDPVDDYAVTWNKLPHWSQTGTVAFITWRTADSIPKHVYRQFVSQRNAFLQSEGLDPFGHWQSVLDALPKTDSLRIKWKLIECFDGRLDECHGACVLRQPELSRLVADSLSKFDGDRYILTDFVVMPNHVHLLAAFPSEETMKRQITGWKRFQARQINALLGRSGKFWQDYDFDHLVRSEAQFEYYRRYIADNGRRGHLKPNQYRHWSRQL